VSAQKQNGPQNVDADASRMERFKLQLEQNNLVQKGDAIGTMKGKTKVTTEEWHDAKGLNSLIHKGRYVSSNFADFFFNFTL
jgi:hypothetical protein